MSDAVKAATASLADDRLALAACLNLSHELRTPVHAILAHAELLLGGTAGPLSREMRCSLGDIQAAGLALVAQIDRLLRLVEEAPARGPSAPTVEAMAAMLESAWSKARRASEQASAADGSRALADDGERPTRWLRLLATLLEELGATQMAMDEDRGEHGVEDGSGSPSPSVQQRTSPSVQQRIASRMDFRYSACRPETLSAFLNLIEAAMHVTGGSIRREADHLTLVWPVAQNP